MEYLFYGVGYALIAYVWVVLFKKVWAWEKKAKAFAEAEFAGPPCPPKLYARIHHHRLTAERKARERAEERTGNIMWFVFTYIICACIWPVLWLPVLWPLIWLTGAR